MTILGHHIGGAAVSGTSGNTAPVFNLATGPHTKQIGLA